MQGVLLEESESSMLEIYTKRHCAENISQILGIRSTGKRDVDPACSGSEGAYIIERHAEQIRSY